MMPAKVIRMTWPSFRHNRIGRAFAFVCALYILAPLYAQHAEIRRGNVYYVDREGNAKQITSDGKDSDANLSPDRRSIIFVRSTGRPMEDCGGPSDPNPTERQIWLAGADGSSWTLRQVLNGPLILDGGCYVSFAGPKIAPDNRAAYVFIPLFATESGIVRIDLETKNTSYVTAGLDFDLVDKGAYRGDLVVLRRTIVDDAIARFYWLVTPDGRDVGFVGKTRDEAQQFMAGPFRVLKSGPPGPGK